MSSTEARINASEAASAPAAAAGIEPVRLIRGASRGFSVLAIGGAVQPLIGLLYEPLGYVWLVVVAVAAFAIAAWHADETAAPLIQGAASSLAAYSLVVPLVLMGAGTLPWEQAVFTTLTALAVGTTTAALRGRRTRRRPKG